MPLIRLIIALNFCAAITACSSEGVKRTTYETLQNVGEQQCEKDFSSDCPERQSYDEYRRSQQEAR
jgi:hypothetical protein